MNHNANLSSSSTNDVFRSSTSEASDKKKIRHQSRFSSQSSNRSSAKPSDRIQSKSRCATFFYNIPRGSLMIAIPGIIILVIGAILIGTDQYPSISKWSDGGMPLVSLIFLILGGILSLIAICYWFVVWIRYKPPLLKKNNNNFNNNLENMRTQSDSYIISGNETAGWISQNASPLNNKLNQDFNNNNKRFSFKNINTNNNNNNSSSSLPQTDFPSRMTSTSEVFCESVRKTPV